MLTDYDPNFSPMSLDEAYLDFTQHLLERGRSSIAWRTYPQVRDWKTDCCCSLAVQQSYILETQNTDAMIPSQMVLAEVTQDLTVSCMCSGVCSKSCAKIINASDVNKQQSDEDDGGVCENETICTKCGMKQGVQDDWKEFGLDVEEAVREMRWRIQQRTGLTASAGECRYYILTSGTFCFARIGAAIACRTRATVCSSLVFVY